MLDAPFHPPSILKSESYRPSLSLISRLGTYINLMRIMFDDSFSGNNWISLVYSRYASWEVRMYVNLTVRNDTGRLNTSPVTTMIPIVRLKWGCNHTITIPGKPERCPFLAGLKRLPTLPFSVNFQGGGRFFACVYVVKSI